MDATKQGGSDNNRSPGFLSRLLDHEGRVILAVAVATFLAVLVVQAFSLLVDGSNLALIGQIVIVVCLLIILERTFYLSALHREISAVDARIAEERVAFARELQRARKAREQTGKSSQGEPSGA